MDRTAGLAELGGGPEVNINDVTRAMGSGGSSSARFTAIGGDRREQRAGGDQKDREAGRGARGGAAANMAHQPGMWARYDAIWTPADARVGHPPHSSVMRVAARASTGLPNAAQANPSFNLFSGWGGGEGWPNGFRGIGRRSLRHCLCLMEAGN